MRGWRDNEGWGLGNSDREGAIKGAPLSNIADTS